MTSTAARLLARQRPSQCPISRRICASAAASTINAREREGTFLQNAATSTSTIARRSRGRDGGWSILQCRVRDDPASPLSTGEPVNFSKLPIDFGVIHYASDTPYTQARTLGARGLSYFAWTRRTHRRSPSCGASSPARCDRAVAACPWSAFARGVAFGAESISKGHVRVENASASPSSAPTARGRPRC